MRLVSAFLALTALILIPFLIWGDALETAFSPAGAIDWLNRYGSWAWAAGMVLLAADVVLPLPSTVIMAALGYVYGPILGGLISTAGSFLSGVLAYSLCRLLGRGAALRLLGQRDLARSELLFVKLGGWLVVLSRWLPVFAEVIACLAGLTSMSPLVFFLALLCGSLPLCFIFASIGYVGVTQPALALILSAALPLLLWLVVRPVFWATARPRGSKPPTERAASKLKDTEG